MKLAESDFRKIQKLISDKHGKKYTLDYIRKVCNGKRNNQMIQTMANLYLQIMREMEFKIENLSKTRNENKSTR